VRAPRRRRRLYVAFAAVAVVAAGATAAVEAARIGHLVGIGGSEATYHSSSTPAVTSTFPGALACTVAEAPRIRCESNTDAAGAYPYELVARVHANSAGAVGGGSVDAQGRELRPPAGVPAWITCETDAGAYACRPVGTDAELPEGAPIYELRFSAWVTAQD
jgi:hypothetical protein